MRWGVLWVTAEDAAVPGELAAIPGAPADWLARVRRDVAEAGEADWQGRALAAEAKVAALRSVLLEGGQPDSTARRRALAIIAGEEGDVRG